MKLFNWFNRSFIEERVGNISVALLEHPSLLSDKVDYYLNSLIYDYSYCIPNWYNPDIDDEYIRKFLKKNKFDIYSDKFDFERLIQCIKNEE